MAIFANAAISWSKTRKASLFFSSSNFEDGAPLSTRKQRPGTDASGFHRVCQSSEAFVVMPLRASQKITWNFKSISDLIIAKTRHTTASAEFAKITTDLPYTSTPTPLVTNEIDVEGFTPITSPQTICTPASPQIPRYVCCTFDGWWRPVSPRNHRPNKAKQGEWYYIGTWTSCLVSTLHN